MTTVADLSIPRKTWSYINTFTSFRIPTGLDIHNRQRGPTYCQAILSAREGRNPQHKHVYKYEKDLTRQDLTLQG
jgi:hypothetical protein